MANLVAPAFRPGWEGRIIRENAFTSRRRLGAFIVGCALVAAFKLWLVFPDEIEARFAPHDQLRYANMAEALIEGRWLGRYDQMTLIRGPGYPLWLWFVHTTGIPLRLAVEGLLISAALLFSAALIRVGLPVSLAFFCYATIVLHPASLAVNRQMLPSGFYGPLLIVAISGLLFCCGDASTRNRLLQASWTGLALGMLWTTRPESPILVLLLGTFAALELLALVSRGIRKREALARVGGVVVVAVLGIVIVSTAIRGQNARHYGAFRTTDLSGPGFTAANRELTSISHAAPRRFVLVPRDVRQRAYEASPALRELEPHLESSSWAYSVSCAMVLVCDDIAAGWFMWALRDAAASAGHARTARDSDAFWGRVAEELEEKRESGELPSQRMVVPFVHPYPETFLPHIFSSFSAVVGRIASAGDDSDRNLRFDSPLLKPRVRRIFDRVANRRVGYGSGKTNSVSHAGRQPFRAALWTGHAWLIRVALVGACVAGLALLAPPRRGRLADRELVVLGLIVAMVLGRVAMLVMIDASWFPARTTRYVYPVAALSTCGLAIAIHAAWRHVRTLPALRHKRDPTWTPAPRPPE